MSTTQQPSYPNVPLAQVLSVLENGSRPPGGVGAIYEGIPSLGGEHLSDDGRFNFKNVRFIPSEFFDKMSRGYIQPSDILLVKDGATTGKVSFVDDDFPFPKAAVNEHLYILRPTADIDAEYLFFYLYSPEGQAQILRNFQGAAIGGINQRFATRVYVPLPPLPEQQQIVKILRQADELRRLSSQSLDEARQLVPTLFREMFGDLNDTDVYTYKKLGEIAAVVSGVTKGRRLGQSAIPVPYLRVANVQAGYLDLTEIKTIEAMPSEVEALALTKGDILLTEGGDMDKLGRGAMWNDEIPDCIHQNHVFRVRVDQQYITPVFFNHLLMTSYAKSYFLRAAKRTTNLASINITQLKKFPIPLPPISDQDGFDAKATEFRNIVEQQYRNSLTYERLYQAMLSQAFTGKLTEGWRQKQGVPTDTESIVRQVVIAENESNISNVIQTISGKNVTPEPPRPREGERLDPVEDSLDPILSPRLAIVESLSDWQRHLWMLAHQTPGYFTPERLASESGKKLKEVEDGLSLLAAAGLILATQVPIAPAGRTFYIPVYRAITQEDVAASLEHIAV